jgi:pimeloyl-ACP methyl ester carboxylesterase
VCVPHITCTWLRRTYLLCAGNTGLRQAPPISARHAPGVMRSSGLTALPHTQRTHLHRARTSAACRPAMLTPLLPARLSTLFHSPPSLSLRPPFAACAAPAATCDAITSSFVHVIHGDGDATIPVADAATFAERLQGRCAVDIIAGGTHSFKTEAEGRSKLVAAVQAALARRVGGPAVAEEATAAAGAAV